MVDTCSWGVTQDSFFLPVIAMPWCLANKHIIYLNFVCYCQHLSSIKILFSTGGSDSDKGSIVLGVATSCRRSVSDENLVQDPVPACQQFIDTCLGNHQKPIISSCKSIFAKNRRLHDEQRELVSVIPAITKKNQSWMGHCRIFKGGD